MSKFKVGDRVAVYEQGQRYVGTIETITSGNIFGVCVKELILALRCHPKQCRKLKPKPKVHTRKVWVNVYEEGQYSYDTKELADTMASKQLRLACIEVELKWDEVSKCVGHKSQTMHLTY